MAGGGGGGQTNTNTQVQQIPAFEQQFAQANQDIAASIASQPYPTYQGQLIAGFNPQQQQGMQQVQDASTAYQPYLNAASGYSQAAAQPWNAQTAQQYMSPYAQAALQPQVDALKLQQAQQQQHTNNQATQAGAFGDARMGVETGINNFNANQQLAGLEAQGMNTAYNTGLGAYQQQQQTLGNVGSQMGNLGQMATDLGQQAGNANFQAGTQQQQLSQEQLAQSYNSFLQQQNWPQNQLYIRESALSNAPYGNALYQSLAPTNASGSNLGAFSTIAGLLGGGGSANANNNPFGSPANPSDIRFKKNISFIGRTAKGIPIYEFNYKWDNEIHVGVLAQQVEAIIPEAVVTNEQGFKFVHYDMVR